MFRVKKRKKIKFLKKRKKMLDFIYNLPYNNTCAAKKKKARNGVWLSLARAPDLGSGGRRFESCHPDACGCSSVVEHQPSKLDMWVRFPSPASILNIELVSVAQLDRATAF